jgi:hypothetical protein
MEESVLKQAKQDLLSMLKSYELDSYKFYKENEGLIKPYQPSRGEPLTQSKDNYSLEIKLGDIHTWAYKNKEELGVYFSEGKHQRFECAQLASKPDKKYPPEPTKKISSSQPPKHKPLF